ncbi:MAG: hypothetical protein GWN61_16615, partial [candidate division Zixibacteria bacterium]|nr:hypothetical protein [candidate division Zixibacteria bacterium]NIV07744.1 hypothetical protein [candidate division Zixibacteria bacterium]NIX58897.1 hypothetical protein [candidate division Zixibacteria bacterium]NIX79753.1 hypothetical protein [candidate division Zixibacteria bacterium]
FTRAKNRQETVLMRMEDEGLISPQQYEEAREAHLALVKPDNEELTYSYFIEYVKQYLIDKYGEET